MLSGKEVLLTILNSVHSLKYSKWLEGREYTGDRYKKLADQSFKFFIFNFAYNTARVYTKSKMLICVWTLISGTYSQFMIRATYIIYKVC